MNEPSALLELQATDVEILRAAKRLDELPEKKAILEIRAKQREVAVMRDKAEMLVRKLEAELKARQDEISTLTEKIAAEQAKIMETTDHRQVQALTREMDGLRRRVDKLEMESLQYMERADKAKGQVATIGQALEQLAEKETGLIDRFKTVGGELQSQIAKLEARRKKTARTLDPDLLKRYEAARASKGGIGVGKLEEATCSACRMSLPAERVRDLVEGPDVAVCPECRRLIVVRTGEPE
jgi:predicted  nucleic acid-binding Zn-ribbon protein